MISIGWRKSDAVCQIPLVLHGGSDTPDQDLRRAIEIGIDKINIWTDVRIPFLRALKETLDGPIEKIEVHEAFAAARAAASRGHSPKEPAVRLSRQSHAVR